MKKIKGFNLKERTIALIEKISEMEEDTQSNTIEKAIDYYARERYGLE